MKGHVNSIDSDGIYNGIRGESQSRINLGGGAAVAGRSYQWSQAGTGSQRNLQNGLQADAV